MKIISGGLRSYSLEVLALVADLDELGHDRYGYLFRSFSLNVQSDRGMDGLLSGLLKNLLALKPQK